MDVPVRTNEVLTDTGLWYQTPHDAAPLEYWVATSPNMTTIPKVLLGPRSLHAYKDGRFGLHDRTLHPQYHADEYEYMTCIRRRPLDPEHSLQLMWWTPTLQDFELLDGMAFSVDIGVLSKKMIRVFRSHRDRYLKASRESQQGKGVSPLLCLLESRVCNCFTKVAGFGMTWKELVFAVAELQRACLDMEAYLDYHLKFKPRIGGQKPAPADEGVMGAFTEKLDVAHSLYMMGIPVWLLRPTFRVVAPKTTIISVVKEELLEGMVLDEWEDEFGNVRPYPMIYDGPPGAAMFRATQQLAGLYPSSREVTRIGMGGTVSTSGANEGKTSGDIGGGSQHFRGGMVQMRLTGNEGPIPRCEWLSIWCRKQLLTLPQYRRKIRQFWKLTSLSCRLSFRSGK